MKRKSVFSKLMGIVILLTATLTLGGFFYTKVEAASLPSAPADYYLDQTNLLTTQTKDLVAQKNAYYQTTKQKPQVILAVVKSTDGEDIDQYAPKLFSKWGIGQKDTDNGILILYAVNDGDKNVRIEVGYGLEGAVTDAQAGQILRANATNLKSADASKVNAGLQKTFNAVTTLIDKEYNYKTDKNTLSDEEMQKIEHPNQVGFPKAIVIGFVIFLLISIFGSRNNRQGPRNGGTGGGSGSLPLWMLGGMLGSSGSYRDRDDDDHFGGFGGFGGGGGGFSGGGGSSGGGGASI